MQEVSDLAVMAQRVRKNQELVKIRRGLTQNLISKDCKEFYAIKALDVTPYEICEYLKGVWFFSLHMIYLGKATKSLHVIFARNDDNIRVSLEIPWSSGISRGFFLRKYVAKTKIEKEDKNVYEALFAQTTDRDD